MKKLIFAVSLFFSLPSLAEEVTIDPTESAPSDGAAKSYSDQIIDIAAASACGRYSWKSRGRAPSGYIKGMALSYGRSLCRLTAPDPSLAPSALGKVMTAPVIGNKTDGLNHYQNNLRACGVNVRSTDENSLLRSLYTLGTGLGMRESSGKCCEGYDVTAKSNASTAEAGLFQTSYNSMVFHPALKELYAEYKAHPEKCLAGVYQENVSCRSTRNSKPVGRGDGADFQAFTKSCPAFATEYAMVMLRVQRRHYGPINRREAEVKSQCYGMFNQIEALIKADPQKACAELR